MTGLMGLNVGERANRVAATSEAFVPDPGPPWLVKRCYPRIPDYERTHTLRSIAMQRSAGPYFSPGGGSDNRQR